MIPNEPRGVLASNELVLYKLSTESYQILLFLSLDLDNLTITTEEVVKLFADVLDIDDNNLGPDLDLESGDSDVRLSESDFKSSDSSPDLDLDDRATIDTDQDHVQLQPRSRSPIDRPSSSGLERGRGRGRRGRPVGKSRPRLVAVDPWKQVGEGETTSSFMFDPPHGSGVLAQLDKNDSALDHFLSNYNDENLINDQLIANINKYAANKVAINTPAPKRSVYNKWYDGKRPKLLWYFAILISMAIQPKPG